MRALNKKARFKYIFLEKLEAGISLTGSEVKAVKAGKVDLETSFIKPVGTELFIINLSIGTGDKDERRTRKLLLHKKQIISLITKVKAKKLTLVPISVYTKGRLIKVKLVLAKSKKTYQKRESLKKKDIQREVERELKSAKQ